MGRAMAMSAVGKQYTDFAYFPVLSAKQEQVFQGAFGLELDVLSSRNVCTILPGY